MWETPNALTGHPVWLRPAGRVMHERDGLSVREIARRLDVSQSSVLAALGKLGIATDCGSNGHAVRGQVRFGRDRRDARLVRNGAEQQAIRLMRLLHDGGSSLNGMALELNRRLVPTKNAGLWRTHTVAKILRRTAGLVHPASHAEHSVVSPARA